MEVHLLEVKKVSLKFPECQERVLAWLPPIEASSQVPEPELKNLIAGLNPNVKLGASVSIASEPKFRPIPWSDSQSIEN